MILKELSLHDFRNYESLDLSFEPGTNIIVGPNAAGKSNIAEAIHFLSLARSWRTQEESSIIRDGANTALITARIEEGGLSRKIEIEIGKSAKRIRINGKPAKRLSELSKICNVILFAPEDVALFSQSPGARRDFLDISLSKQSIDYFSLISRYQRLLKERNALLKSPNIDMTLLEVVTEQLCQIAEPIVHYRTMFVSSLSTVLPEVLAQIRGDNATAELVYRPCARDDGTFGVKIRSIFKEALEGDLMRKTTGNGPHRDDLLFKLNGKDISEYGSQGENRMAVLALKLSPSFLIEEVEKKPICVLDDVTSELDDAHIQRLADLFRSFPQVFVTTTKLDIVDASYIDVSSNTATRRK